MPCSDHAVLLKVTAQHGRLSTAVPTFIIAWQAQIQLDVIYSTVVIFLPLKFTEPQEVWELQVK